MATPWNADLLAAVDAGTTGTRCCLFDVCGNMVASGYCPIPKVFPGPGLVEQRPNDVIKLTFRAVRAALDSEMVDPRRVIGLCLTAQRNSFAPIARDGSFLGNMITWCDQRGAEIHPWIEERLASVNMTAGDLYRRNGQPLASFQCGYKALWLSKYQKDLYDRVWLLASPLAFLLRAFGAEAYFEERDNRSFWLIADADDHEIDPGLCELFGIRSDIFPTAIAPGSAVGVVAADTAAITGLLPGTPIYIGSGDQNCGVLGAGNYGTSDIVSICNGTAGLCIAYSNKPVRHPRALCQIQGHPAGGYLIEAHSSSCMASYQWAKELLVPQCDEDVSGAADEIMGATANAAPAGSNGVIFLPYLQGSACPNYDDSARGAYVGMSLATKRCDMVRATLEGICFENKMMLEALMEVSPSNTHTIRIIGGGSNSEVLNQMQADICKMPVETPATSEATALGAAMILAVAEGVYTNYHAAAENMVRVRNRYMPSHELGELYESSFRIWNECYRGLARRAVG